MKRYSFLFVSIFVMAGLLLSGATALGSDTKYTIGVSAQLVSHDWSIQAKEGIQEEAKRQGVETVLLSAGQDPAKQLTDIEALIERDVNGAIILLAETSVLEKGVNRLRQAGIPVIYVDGGYEAPGVIQNISSDNYDIGRRAAYYLINQLGTKFNIVLQTYPVLTATDERTKGFKAVAEHFPGIKILEEQPLLGPEWVEQAQQHAERMLAKYAGQVDAFGVCSDLFATGSSAGIDSAGLSDKVIVTGTDGLSQIIERISTQSSSMRMTFLQDSKTMGVTAVQTLVKFLDAGGQIPQTGKQIVEPVVQIPAIMVTRENASNYVKK